MSNVAREQVTDEISAGGSTQRLFDLPLGAHLVTRRRGYAHHGVYVGEGQVVHYAGWDRAFRGGPVEEVSLDRFGRGRGFRVRTHAQIRYAPPEIVQRARSRLGESRYQVLTNNCEHFCHWCLFGESRSEQVDRLRTLPAFMAGVILLSLSHLLAGLRLRQRSKFVLEG